MDDPEQLISIDEERSDPVALVGYPRKGDPRRVRRLYKTPDSETYVEIKVADMVDPPSEGDEAGPDQVVIWVRGGAKVLLVELPVGALYARPPWPRR